MKTNFSRFAPIVAAGVIPHQFIDAKDAPGQYAAEQCGRQAVTTRWLYEHPDVYGYIYSKDADDLGLDPWTTIEGVDLATDSSSYFLEYGRTGEKRVGADFEVYANRKHVERESA